MTLSRLFCRCRIPLLGLALTLASCTALSQISALQPARLPGGTVTPTVEDLTQPADGPDAMASIEAGAEATPLPPNTDSLRFVFPTPGLSPKSAWRPPLYDVPWAAGPYDHFYFVRPIAADEVNWPLADYRYGGIFPGTDNIVHTGVDIDAPAGTPVLAAAPGKVVWAGWGLFTGSPSPKDPYGIAVSIRHDFGYNGERLYTIYAHMSRVDVVVGQRVNTHDQLGLVGDTGRTTGPHLHFEVRIGSNEFLHTLNPELWLAPPQGWGVLVGRLIGPDGLLLHSKEVTVTAVETGTFWVVRTYGPSAINSDPYYNENLVLSDLPAGKYKVSLSYEGGLLSQPIEILPGRISYFTFAGKNHFKTALPPTPNPKDFMFRLTPTK
ncbi:MAG TPA: M23 family metallopeptidase [Anaerolineaceae bacterium]|nr:M23 family metallopeptidase [Anaerolineaceae bacterium]